jgi:hypothetical protein
MEYHYIEDDDLKVTARIADGGYVGYYDQKLCCWREPNWDKHRSSFFLPSKKGKRKPFSVNRAVWQYVGGHPPPRGKVVARRNPSRPPTLSNLELRTKREHYRSILALAAAAPRPEPKGYDSSGKLRLVPGKLWHPTYEEWREENGVKQQRRPSYATGHSTTAYE